jgi:ubiquitin-conjugating enzyme E2 D/E
MTAFIRRLTIHFNEIQKNRPPLCYAEPKDPTENMTHWTGYIDGPEDTPYAGGRFKLTIDFPSSFPFKPPHVQFITPVFHPNISEKGEICLDLLHSQWSPALSVRDLLISLCSLLTDPNPDHGLNTEAIKLYRADRAKYDKIVKTWTMKYATENNH